MDDGPRVQGQKGQKGQKGQSILAANLPLLKFTPFPLRLLTHHLLAPPDPELWPPSISLPLQHLLGC